MQRHQASTRRIGWVTLGRLSGIAALLLVNVILARNLPPADYGYYQQIWVLLNIAIPIFLFGLPVSINFFIPPLSGQERNNLMLQHVLLNLCMAFLFLGCVGGLGLAYRSTLFGIGPDTVPLLPIAAIGFGMIVCGFWEAFLIVYNKPKWLAISLVFFLVDSSVRGLVGILYREISRVDFYRLKSLRNDSLYRRFYHIVEDA